MAWSERKRQGADDHAAVSRQRADDNGTGGVVGWGRHRARAPLQRLEALASHLTASSDLLWLGRDYVVAAQPHLARRIAFRVRHRLAAIRVVRIRAGPNRSDAKVRGSVC